LSEEPREPRVAGQFYPSSKEKLLRMLRSFFDKVKVYEKSIAGVAPHAGYIYSGKTAAFTHSALEDVDTYVILGPDHTGAAMGGNIVYPSGSWGTPLGITEIDEEAVKAISDVVTPDKAAHTYEHSLEVQLPFLQYLHEDFRIVPIIMGDQSLETATILGEALSELNCVVIASSDFSHYVPYELARENDKYAIKAILDLDIEEFYKRIRERNVTACGYGPVAAAAVFAEKKGCIEVKLLDYSTSGDVTGDPTVVGYVSIIFV